jgi:hypothetical protein
MASVINQIIAQTVANLTTTMITNETDEELHPGLIRAGLLQENPVPYRIVVLVHHNDPDDSGNNPFWGDITASEDDESGWKMPPAEVGGGEFMSRRFILDIKIYFVRSKENRQAAREAATAVIENAEAGVRMLNDNMHLISPSSQGEMPIQVKLYRTVSAEGGGPPASHIWSAKVMFTVLTEIP